MYPVADTDMLVEKLADPNPHFLGVGGVRNRSEVTPPDCEELRFRRIRAHAAQRCARAARTGLCCHRTRPPPNPPAVCADDLCARPWGKLGVEIGIEMGKFG
jgi:hypothetical protein